MKAISRRLLQRLEARLSPQEDLRAWRTANVLYDRRRRLAEAAGQPFEDMPPRPGRGPRLSIAETLCRRREQLALSPATDGPKIDGDKNEYR